MLFIPVFLPYLLEISSFVYTGRINLLCLKPSSKTVVIVQKQFLKLPNLLMSIKENSISLHRNLALATFAELLRVFSTKINLIYIPYEWS